MPYCVLLKNGRYVDARGNVRPCCSFMFNEHLAPGDTFVYDAESLHNKMLKGWIPECNQCERNENFSEVSNSLRTISNRHEHDYYARDLPPELSNQEVASSRQSQYELNQLGYNFVHLDVSNQCNLACRMCGVSQSTGWNPVRLYYNEGEEIYNWHKTLYPKLKSDLLKATEIKFTGGEPMLMPMVKKILRDVIEHGNSHQVKLRIITNGTQILTDEWKDIFSQFNSIKIDISVDALGKRYEYIRPNSNWDITRNNVREYANFFQKPVEVTALNMNINVAVQEEMKDYWKKENIGLHLDSPLVSPDYLTYRALPHTLRERYNIETDEKFERGLCVELYKQMDKLDTFYDTSFKDACPEFFDDKVLKEIK
jgi:sulfatase maturation enzyme AslB (radical SAM superfamily)